LVRGGRGRDQGQKGEGQKHRLRGQGRKGGGRGRDQGQKGEAQNIEGAGEEGRREEEMRGQENN
jgi:hypothetical protein